MKKDDRLPWDNYFMGLTDAIASRSTCLRRHVGAIAVNSKHRIIGTGYNGAPSGMMHCTPETCIRIVKQIPSGQQLDICKAIHAEANIVLQLGYELQDATLYCNTQPCTNCLKLLIGSGIKRIVWKNAYDDPYAKTLMEEYGNLTEINEDDFHAFSLERIDPDNTEYYSYISYEQIKDAYNKYKSDPIIL